MLVRRWLPWIVVASFTNAQARELEVPWDSPRAVVTQTIGITDVTITYHRPALAERDAAMLYAVPGAWRFGANNATTIQFEHDVTIDGETVPAGRYGLFAMPAEDEWTLIISKQADLWGSFAYQRGQDVLRFDVKPTAGESIERLTFDVVPQSNTSGRVTFAWGTLRIAFDVEVATDENVAAGIEETLKRLDPDDWDTRLVIAKYWTQRDEELQRAEALIDEALAKSRNFWTLEWKARLLVKRGANAEAVLLIEAAIEDAKGKTPREYIAGLEELLQASRA
ncbi:MAG: DUF2911 domain-containing protein [Planctomycetes bacterium]|nr:DUF2911 domain-containing protein [Planctomycetota bacterium]MCC7172814.1 DUF2911 domain-containing protein [Planctomycetota bacterium]